MERHGPLVWCVCRSTVSNPHDAEDAFQATFMVLVRKIGSLRLRVTLGAWLHTIARRIALATRAAAARRREIERASSIPSRESGAPQGYRTLGVDIQWMKRLRCDEMTYELTSDSRRLRMWTFRISHFRDASSSGKTSASSPPSDMAAGPVIRYPGPWDRRDVLRNHPARPGRDSCLGVEDDADAAHVAGNGRDRGACLWCR
ncbi:RNA polymerase sigma factor [Aquisphaera insulae]|uniref:RNA polymerase sigma factor n=1 Tax=Aquisphaera insulae TaxID=2712864 RepID=UPI00203034A9|nr:sigma-70 family RNA polymerase sigma factor [Aquisphaera insulae]